MAVIGARKGRRPFDRLLSLRSAQGARDKCWLARHRESALPTQPASCRPQATLPPHLRQNSSRDSHCRCARGDVGNYQSARSNRGTIPYGHCANDARVASDKDVIAYGSSPWSRPCSDSAHVVDSAVGPDLGARMHPHRANVRNEQTRADLSIGVNINVCHHGKQLVYHAKCHPCGYPKPSGSTPLNCFSRSIKHKRPKALRPPAAVSMFSEACKICPTRPPLAIASPTLNCISIVIH